MKFDKYQPTEGRYGFQFIKDGIMVGKIESECIMCGSPTKYIEIYSEGRFCSDECVEEFYNQYQAMLRKSEQE